MPERASWPAPAKLNLFLHITGRRSDGYHELQTVFQLLDWGDEVHIEPGGSDIERVKDIPGLAAGDDLSILAAHRLRDACGVRQGARIGVSKNIPQGAGLGGASSDAATVLHALNQLWGCGLGTEDLAEIGLSLGADVPLFVHGHSAWAEGVGERLQPVNLGASAYVLAFPQTRISTVAVFADPGLKRDSKPLSRATVMADPHGQELRNDGLQTVLDQHPELRELFARLAAFGTPKMTGTGSTFFLRFGEKNEALRVTQKLKSRYNVRAVGGVNQSALLKRLATE